MEQVDCIVIGAGVVGLAVARELARGGRETIVVEAERGIGTGVHYRAVHTLAFYRERFGLAPKDLPVAWRIGEQTVSLPLQASLTDDEVERVVTAVREVLHP